LGRLGAALDSQRSLGNFGATIRLGGRRAPSTPGGKSKSSFEPSSGGGAAAFLPPRVAYSANCPFSAVPGMPLERRLQRRVGDVAGIVCDCRGRDRRDDFEQTILAKPAARKRLRP